jgi:glycosyltransferase involved in cell wall biosynthesis
MVTRTPPFLSVVLPVYNEEERLEQNVQKISDYLTRTYPDHEIIAVDDGSSDRSPAILQALATRIPRFRAIQYSPNAGKGMAVRTGMQAAQGEWIATVDSDLELPIEMLPDFFAVQKETGAKIVVGSKRHPRSVVIYPRLRRFLSRSYGLLLASAFSLPVVDTQVGFKLFHRDTSSKFVSHLLVKRFAFDLELLVVQHRVGFLIAEAPVTLRFNRPGSGRIRIGTVLNIARETAGIWYRLYITRFYDQTFGIPPQASQDASLFRVPN